MSWTQAVSLIALMIAIGKFLDAYHHKGAGSARVIEWIRSLLVWLFVKLEETRPTQIAGMAFRVPVWLQVLTVLFSAVLVFAAGGFIFLLVNYLGKQSYPVEVLYWTIGFAVVLQLVVFYLMRLLARYANDILATIAIVVMPFLFAGAIAAPVAAAAEHPGLSGLWLAIYLFCTLTAGSIPILLVLLIAISIMALKYVTLAIRWVTMHVADAASSPSVSPFAYFAALGGLLVLAFKTLGYAS